MTDKWGRRLFTIGAVVLLLLALVHSLSLFGKPAPANDTERQLLDLMSNYKFNVMGSMRSMDNFLRGFSISFMLGVLALGAIDLPRTCGSAEASGADQHALAGRDDCRVSALFLYFPHVVSGHRAVYLRGSVADPARRREELAPAAAGEASFVLKSRRPGKSTLVYFWAPNVLKSRHVFHNLSPVASPRLENINDLRRFCLSLS